MADKQAFAGFAGLTDAGSSFNFHDFHIEQKLGRIRTIHPVMVINVDTEKQTVDVQPMVHQVDGKGKQTPHGTVFGIPWHSMSGANGMFITIPKKGDNGHMAIADRDISKVKATAAPAVPDSNRTHDFSDGIYMGGFGAMNKPENSMTMEKGKVTVKTPTQSMTFNEGSGIQVKASPKVAVDGDHEVSGKQKTQGTIESKTGFKFPDGSLQTSAASAGMPGPAGPAGPAGAAGPPAAFATIEFTGDVAGLTVSLSVPAKTLQLLFVNGLAKAPSQYSVSSATLTIPAGLTPTGSTCFFTYQTA